MQKRSEPVSLLHRVHQNDPRTAPIPALAPVTSTTLSFSREVLNTDILRVPLANFVERDLFRVEKETGLSKDGIIAKSI